MKKEKYMIYDPPVGLTIEEAFARAILLSKKTGQPINAIVNDIEMVVTDKTNLKKVVDSFRKKIEANYVAECKRAEAKRKRTATIKKKQPVKPVRKAKPTRATAKKTARQGR